MTSHKKMITYLWSFSFSFFTIHNIWSFWINTSHFEIDALNFWYFNLMNKPLAFRHHTFSIQVAFIFLVKYYNVRWLLQLIISFILRFTFVKLCKQKKKKRNVWRYISTSLCKYQNHQDYWPIIHDKLENRFTTITHRFQDFSHKDRCAYIIS